MVAPLVELPPVQPLPIADTVAVTWWEHRRPAGADPQVIVPNDYEGGFQAGLDDLILQMGQPTGYSRDFLRGWSDGHTARDER